MGLGERQVASKMPLDASQAPSGRLFGGIFRILGSCFYSLVLGVSLFSAFCHHKSAATPVLSLLGARKADAGMLPIELGSYSTT